MDDFVRVRRKDTTKGPPLRILSLDGGGIRGYSMLIILQELMHRTFVEIEGRAPKRDEIPKPCDHFDLIVGTGTGGLIAIMLGRLRLDLDTCKDVYVRMTRKVFQTDKTVFGVPWRSTMFKASMLEEAIRETVREHTVFEDEGNDTLANAAPMTPTSIRSSNSNIPPIPSRTMSQSSHYSQIGQSPLGNRVMIGSMKPGNPNALLYDTREKRTKTAVAAVLKGTNHTVLLRSYDSRKEPAPDVNCAIWQAGRATSATHMAFKPIQIGQSVYLDEGAGKYNPAPLALDEAVANEWPGREVGVFVSVGTGKRPNNPAANQHEWWEGFLGGSMGEFAEARRKMIQKLENCEKAHEFMLKDHLATRGVNPETYYRLNVEVGVGEFGMNEWARLSEISTGTRAYLSKKEVEALTCGAAAKIAKIYFAKIRHDRAEARRAAGTDHPAYASQNPWERPLPTVPPPQNFAVELPGDDEYRPGQHYADGGHFMQHKYSLSTNSDVYDRHNSNATPTQQSYNSSPALSATRPSFEQQQSSGAAFRLQPNSYQYHDHPPSPRHSADFAHPPSSPPPVPPKTPVNGAGSVLPYPDRNGPPPIPPPAGTMAPGHPPPPPPMTFMNMGSLGRNLPYGVVGADGSIVDEVGQGPPPPVNMGNKPTLS
ncbi:unnamed protein product [Cercospora beticola]|nr:unnamed protein product [Cercospora beticola]